MFTTGEMIIIRRRAQRRGRLAGGRRCSGQGSWCGSRWRVWQRAASEPRLPCGGCGTQWPVAGTAAGGGRGAFGGTRRARQWPVKQPVAGGSLSLCILFNL
uniref:Uncharacterized protein n=1 Tax=Leersia perrieri TaxID=77586 RepID=A0A0D9X7D6_9ORYZ